MRLDSHIDTKVCQQAEETYRKLITAAYMMATDGQPLSSFKTIVGCLKMNGLKLNEGCDGQIKAQELTGHLADAVRAKIGHILSSSSAFGILCDAFQGRKPGKEKEMIFVRAVGADGKSKYYLASLQDMNYSCGNPISVIVKNAIDDTFLKQLGISEHEYREKVVSITADDGAPVHTGLVNDLFVQMAEDDRPWLLGINCSLHGVELAIKDSLLQHKPFKTVTDLMIVLYTLMKPSGEFANHFQTTATDLNVQVYRFPRVHGSRFVSRLNRGLEVILHNWIPLLVAIQTSIETESHEIIKDKLVVILRKLMNVNILAAACLFKTILDILSKLLLKFEENRIQLFDVRPSVDLAIIQLEELRKNNDSVIESAGMTLMDNVLQREIIKPGS